MAREIFFELGFAGATMQEVATRARISKTSLYQEHASKDDLFEAVVRDWAAQGRGAMRPYLDRLLIAADLHGALVELAATIQSAVLSPDVIRMRRLVAAESDRFPETAAVYLADSWTSNIAALAQTMATLARRGDIVVSDPLVTAHQFTWTAVGAALNAHTIGGTTARTPPRVLRRFARAAADLVVGASTPQKQHR